VEPASAISRSASLRDERGFTIVEVLVAALILALGLGAALLSFGAPQKLGQVAERESQAAAIAEADLESIVGRPYNNIAVSSLPAHAADPDTNNPANPDFFVTTDNKGFQIEESFHDASKGAVPELVAQSKTSEPLVLADISSNLKPTDATPAGAPAGTIHRYITYRSEPCDPNLGSTLNSILNQPLNAVSGLLSAVTSSVGGGVNAFCGASNNQKRVTVAVTLNPTGTGAGPLKPVYASTLVPNPAAGLIAGKTCALVSAAGICL
jgi:prepilin-type N-terminal cleavage/methylation domain-containing protein